MTKKDYVIIAEIFNSIHGYNSAERALKIDLVNRFCKALKKENAKFDEQKFLTACGMIENHYHGHKFPSFIQEQNGEWICNRCGINVTDKEMELKVLK